MKKISVATAICLALAAAVVPAAPGLGTLSISQRASVESTATSAEQQSTTTPLATAAQSTQVPTASAVPAPQSTVSTTPSVTTPSAKQAAPTPAALTQAAPTTAAAAPVASPSALSSPTATIPSIGPLFQPTAGAGKTAQAAAVSESVKAATPQALVPDSNTAAIKTVFDAINTYRVQNKLSAMKYHPTVAGMAQEWSNNIASRGVVEHRANFWLDPRALNPNNGAGEVIAIRGDRDAAQLVEWWKSSTAHNAALLDPRFNVMGIGITYTDQTYKIWGVVNFFGYTTLPSGTVTAPSGTAVPPQPTQPQPVQDACTPPAKHMPSTQNLSTSAIRSGADVVAVNAAGALLDYPATGTGTLGAARTIGTGFATTKAVFTTDWDRDGVYDVIAQWTSGKLSLYRGILGGGFRAEVVLGKSGWDTMKISIGEWCATNRMPQIVAADASGNVYLYPNMGLGDLATRTFLASGTSAVALTMVDYDGDGFQDLLVQNAAGSVSLYRSRGQAAVISEARTVVATGWQTVIQAKSLKSFTALNSRGVVLQRNDGSASYLPLGAGGWQTPVKLAGVWSQVRMAR
ncbi:CAP domain-containing protein [Pseudarthrobacter sp. J1763]|uniref:CAP domain-containing protein n=1 Tax=Pseudarthrobacter sp. J1763 TaxID=3420445 RepID=UPI003D2D2232